MSKDLGFMTYGQGFEV